MNTLFVGDIHGDFGALNKLINKKLPDVVIQLGDNAYFWRGQKNGERAIKPGKSIVFLLPGNHEDWVLFDRHVGRRGREPIEIEQNIFYCPIGSEIELNGKKIMFIGGAESIDKARRVAYDTWFPEELLNQEDLDFCLSTPNKIDIICSHTCPYDFQIFQRLGIYEKANDPTMRVLNEVLFNLKPESWFFGHWHDFVQGKVADCRFWGLNCSLYTKWWMTNYV